MRKVGESDEFVRSNVASLKQFRVHPGGVSLDQLKQICSFPSGSYLKEVTFLLKESNAR